tara:strand:- start:394 stop:1530 length:1137 start_codon:yes stop_codon:yes gene_type:complete
MNSSQRKRTGPAPLGIHTGMLQIPFPPFEDFAQKNLQPYSQDECLQIIRGIQAYQSSTHMPDKPPLRCIYEDNGIKLLKVGRDDIGASYKHSLIIIPSLINNAEIFNLNTERSFMLWLQKSGVEAFLLDWGDLHQNRPNETIENLISVVLPHVIDVASKNAQNKLAFMGYCMGGTLLMAARQFLKQENPDIILLASPWNFHVKGTAFYENVRLWSPYALNAIEQRGYLPALWTQSLFAMLDMPKAGAKFIDFAQMKPNSSKARLFVDVEDWLNSGCDLPKDIAQHCIREWFSGNVTAQNQWVIKNTKIDLSSCTSRVLVIASEKDKITPYESAYSILLHLKNADTHLMKRKCGHISYIAGRKAIQDIWQPLLEWLEEK